MKYRIVTWNVNGIRASAKKGLETSVREMKPTYLCLQETKAHLEQVEPSLQTLGFKNSLWSSATKKGYSGVATFTDLDLSQAVRGWGQEEYDSEGRIVISENQHFKLYNIYFPNGGSGEERHLFKQKFLQDLNSHLRSELKTQPHIIVVGDYNVAPTEKDVHDPVRLSKVSGFLPEERAWFADFLNLGFVDTFRNQSPDATQRYSWWDYRQMSRISNKGWRIDFICCSTALQKHLQHADILDQIEGSDHCPVLADFEF